jgi:hypothetical protein
VVRILSEQVIMYSTGLSTYNISIEDRVKVINKLSKYLNHNSGIACNIATRFCKIKFSVQFHANVATAKPSIRKK